VIRASLTKAFKNGTNNAVLNPLRFAHYHSARLAGMRFPDLGIVKDIFDEHGNIADCELRARGEIKMF
jgi:hypothetical protein